MAAADRLWPVSFKGKRMRHILVVVPALLLAGCGIPTAVNMAMYAFEGATVAMSGRSTTDHVISAAMKKDCVVFRIVLDKPVRRDNEPKDATVAVVADPGS